jgi:hypothetical protein
VQSEELPDSIQHTKERKPDLLKKITDDKGNVFVLHIEFQTRNDSEMVYRMFEYLAMLLRKFKLPVKQYVIYIGEEKIAMPTTLTNEASFFSYNLVDISAIDYRVFLRSVNIEEKMFAILANYGADSAETAVTKIVDGVAATAGSGLEWLRRKNQLRILANLRSLVVINIEIMESVASFYKIENDIVYKVGEKNGREEGVGIGIEMGKTSFILYLLTETNLSMQEIAKKAEMPISFVEKVKASLSK